MHRNSHCVALRACSSLCFALFGSSLVVETSSDAVASPGSDVASALDDNDHFDLHATLSYRFASRSSAIKREFVGLPGTRMGDALPLVRDLVFSSSRHEVIPALELGIFHDLWLSAALPVVLHDTRNLSFDQRNTPCSFAGSTPTCINAQNSTTVADGLLPDTGYDANDPSGPGFTNPGDDMIFRGPTRRGTTQLHLGLGFAPMNQERDPSKPTWKIGGQIRLPIGKVKKLNRIEPDKANGSSEGVTHIRLWTSMAKKVNWAEPHVDFWWQAPISIKKNAPLAELDQGFGVSSEAPQQEAGATFGVDATLWDSPEDDLRVGLDLSTTLTAYFEGRGYSDMWEVFQYAGFAPASDAPLVLDTDPTNGQPDAKSHPGVSNLENFMTLDTHLQITADAGEKIRFAAGVGLQYEQSHLISFANAGNDLPTCIGGAAPGCETDNNDLVDLGSVEVNPLHVPTIDLAGHRYRVAEGKTLLFTVNARILF